MNGLKSVVVSLSPGLIAAGLSMLLSTVTAVAAGPEVVTLPGTQTNVEGNANNLLPFQTIGSSSVRYQQVIAASEFAAGPWLISQIALRPDTEFGTQFAVDISSLQINLSTTRAIPDALSTSFADNVGTDDRLVFDGPLHLTSAVDGPIGEQKAFDYLIPLQTPFLYDPSAGNLLLDIRNLSRVFVSTGFDSQFAIGDSVSRVFTSGTLGQDVTSPIGLADTLGLVVQLTMTPAVAQVSIAIKPEDPFNSIHVKNHGKIAVAVLSSATFDARRQVDRTTLTFGHTGNEASLDSCNRHGQDVNGDRILDLVCNFSSKDTGFQVGDGKGVLKGKTFEKISVVGTDNVRIIK